MNFQNLICILVHLKHSEHITNPDTENACNDLLVFEIKRNQHNLSYTKSHPIHE